MIIKTTVGICDRCSLEERVNLYKISVNKEKMVNEELASNHLQYTHGIGVLNANFLTQEGYHLCDSCFSAFKRFIKNV